MRLSKQERIGVLIIAVIIIILVGVFLFIVPRFEAIGVSNTDLVNVQTELKAAVDKANTKEDLKNQVLSAYANGSDTANMFFEELEPYQADQEFNRFIASCKDAGINIVVDELSVSQKGVSTLSVAFTTETEVNYDLKTYVTQGVEPSEEALAAQARRETLQAALSSAQNVGSITVTFSASALDLDTLIDFADAVNSYYKNEDSGESSIFFEKPDSNSHFIRKAVALSGLTVNYNEIRDKYEAMVNDMVEEINDRATSELYKNTGYTPRAGTTTTTTDTENTNTNQNQEEAVPSLEDNIYTLSATVTFYSVERMQDPTDQLAAQDASAA